MFKGTESAIVFNSGYAANTGLMPAIAGEDDVIFSDELNHASIIDGCRLSRAKTIIYRHGDIVHLNELIRNEISTNRSSCGKFIIVTDTVFSMDGDIGPLNDIYSLCRDLNSDSKLQTQPSLYRRCTWHRRPRSRERSTLSLQY